jgi:hypothetical protein
MGFLFFDANDAFSSPTDLFLKGTSPETFNGNRPVLIDMIFQDRHKGIASARPEI